MAGKTNVSSFHIGVSAEAFVAAQFARYGIDISVQYGANQPEYDLIAHKNDSLMKISVKGSQDGSWALTQKYLKDCDYHRAIDDWLKAHGKKTVFCLVQFKDTKENEMPRLYLATPKEIAEVLHSERNGHGDTILYENHEWTNKSVGAGTVDTIPDEWILTEERVKCFLEMYAG